MVTYKNSNKTIVGNPLTVENIMCIFDANSGMHLFIIKYVP